MTISVVTVTRNDRAGLELTVASLADQTHYDVEHVVIDGDSSDGSAQWAREHPAARHVVVVSEPDDGIYDAMNKGLATANGQLVTFLNSGDVLADPHVLADVWRSFVDKGWLWAYGDAVRRLPSGVTVRRRCTSTYSWLRQTYWRYDICHQSTFVRRDSLMDLGGFDASLQVAGDYAVALRLGRLAPPQRLMRTICEVLADGVSETSPLRAHLEAHASRVKVLELSAPRKALDRGWTTALVGLARVRRRLRVVRDDLADNCGNRAGAP